VLGGELEIRLVHQRRGVEGVVGALAPQPAARHSPQLVVKQRHQPIEGAGLATPERLEAARDVAPRDGGFAPEEGSAPRCGGLAARDGGFASHCGELAARCARFPPGVSGCGALHRHIEQVTGRARSKPKRKRLEDPDMRIHRHLIVLVVACALFAGTALAKDFRTTFVRIVAETDWRPAKEQGLAIEVTTEATHENAAEFVTALTAELTEQFGRVLGYSVDPNASTKVKFTVVEFDPGNAALRFGVGFGTGKAYVGGTIEVLQEDAPIGSLLYSLQPSLPSPAAMARESAGVIALKLSNGERDAELHPLKAKKSKNGKKG
jgi:hypothetical protein